MNKFQKLAQLNRDIELLENAGKIKAAEVLHQKFIKEAQYAMPMTYNPFMVNPLMYSMMARPVVNPGTMPVAQPAVTPVTTPATVTQPAPVATPAPKPAPVPVGETAKPTPVAPPPPTPSPTPTPGGQPGNMQIAPMPKPTPTEQGSYNMEPGPGGKTVFTDPRNGLPTDPPGSDQVFDYYYGKIQEAYGLPEPQKSQMLKKLFDQIKQRGNKLGGRLQGSLLNQYFDGSGKPLY
jgi:hypothetical protein